MIISEATKNYLIKRPPVRPGDIVRVHQEVQEGKKKRIQIFEGMVIKTQHGKGTQGTFTVRRVSLGVGVEKTFPLHLPAIKKIEIKKHSKVRRSKLYYLRNLTGKKGRLKDKKLSKEVIKLMATIEDENQNVNIKDQNDNVKIKNENKEDELKSQKSKPEEKKSENQKSKTEEAGQETKADKKTKDTK